MADFDEAPLGDDVLALLGDQRVWGEPPSDLADRVVAAVGAEAAPSSEGEERPGMPAWMRPALLGAAAVVVVLFGGIALFSATDDGPGGQVALALAPTSGGQDVSGEVELAESSSGVSIELDAPRLPYLEGDRFYEAWVHTSAERVVPVGTFRGGERVTLWAGVDLDDITRFTVTRERAESGDSAEQRTSGDVVLWAAMPGR
jgi:hypothetical protein